MTLSMHQASAPVFIQGLEGLTTVMRKAEARAVSQGFDPVALLQARLDKAVTDAAKVAKDRADADQARAEPALAEEARNAAAAKLAALTDKKKA